MQHGPAAGSHQHSNPWAQLASNTGEPGSQGSKACYTFQSPVALDTLTQRAALEGSIEAWVRLAAGEEFTIQNRHGHVWRLDGQNVRLHRGDPLKFRLETRRGYFDDRQFRVLTSNGLFLRHCACSLFMHKLGTPEFDFAYRIEPVPGMLGGFRLANPYKGQSYVGYDSSSDEVKLMAGDDVWFLKSDVVQHLPERAGGAAAVADDFCMV